MCSACGSRVRHRSRENAGKREKAFKRHVDLRRVPGPDAANNYREHEEESKYERIVTEVARAERYIVRRIQIERNAAQIHRYQTLSRIYGSIEQRRIATKTIGI